MLIKPTLLTISSFDADKQNIFSFTVPLGGKQIVANKLIIRNQNDNSIVYEVKQDTFRYEHKLPAKTLVNGAYYNAVVIVYDITGQESVPSSPIQFRCYTTPTIEFTNIPDNNIVNNYAYSFSFQYNQIQGEPLNSYIFNVYNASNVLVGSSGEKYVGDGTPIYNGSYLFVGFDDKVSYYVEIIGKTVNGITIKTERKRIEINYKKPDFFSLMTLNNNCEDGYISVTSNIVLVNGDFNPDPPVFIDDKEIDLTEEDSYIDWNKGYSINGDYLLRAWFRKPKSYSQIIQLSNTQGQTIKIEFMNGYENVNSNEKQAYVQVSILSLEGCEYYIFSNYIDILTDSQYYSLQLQKTQELYQVKLLKMI